MEQMATELETAILLAYGEPVRAKYDDAVYTVKIDNPTLHTDGYLWKMTTWNGKTWVDNYTGDPFKIPKLNEMVPIDVTGSGGGGGGGVPADGGGVWVPGDIPLVDPTIPKTGHVDVLPGVIAPSPSHDLPVENVAASGDDEVILIGPVILPPSEM